MKAKKRRKKSYLLDTSVHLELAKYPEISKYLQGLRNKNMSLVSSFFVFYEFRVGLIKSILEFYFLVRLYGDVGKAIAKWSEKFGTRPHKNFEIFSSVLSRVVDSVQFKDVERYLDSIQAVIFYLDNGFDAFLDNLVGSFANDDLVKMKLVSEKDYGAFIDLYNGRKILPMSEFWSQHVCELDKILGDTKFTTETKYLKVVKVLREIRTDFKNADKHNNNKTVGDSVIAVDCGKDREILSFDASFGFLCAALNKKSTILAKNDPAVFTY